MAKMTKEQTQAINYELMKQIPNSIIVDWKVVEFDNGFKVPKLEYVIAQHRIIGEGALNVSTFRVVKNYYNNQISGLIKV